MKYSLTNNIWRITRDPYNEGIDQQFCEIENYPYMDDKEVEYIPSCYNRKLAPFEDYKGTVWYFQQFQIPLEFKRKKFYLRIERVSGSAAIYIDGQEVGTFRGGFLPFKFDISHLTPVEKHYIAIQVKPDERERQYGGIFGDIYIETYKFLEYSDMHMTTKINRNTDGSLNYSENMFSIYLKNMSEYDFQGDVEITISQDFIPIQSEKRNVEVLKNNSRLLNIPLQIDLKNDITWSPENPNVLDLEIVIGNEEHGNLIEIKDIIGIREIEIKDEKVIINGKDLEGKAKYFDIGMPEFGYAIPKEVIKNKLKELKNQGVSVLKPLQGTFDKYFLELASRIGILTIGNVPFRELKLIETQQYYNDYIYGNTFQPCIAFWSVNSNILSKLESDPNIHKRLLDLEKLYTTNLDPSRFFIIKDFLKFE